MLKQIIVRNFASFRDKQTLDFEPGYYFMIGENDSGKSSLFEIIRGCMGPSKSTCLTKPHDLAKPSIAMCFFRVCNNTDEVNLKDKNETEVKTVKAHGDEDLGERKLVSALIRPWPCLKVQDDAKQEDIYLKLVHVIRNGGEKDEFKMAYLTATDSSGNELVWKSVNQSCSKDIRKELEYQKEWRTDPDHILQTINKYLTPEKLREDEDKTETVEFENILKRYINKATVVTFPLSGISTCQWTKSKRLKKKNNGQNVEHYEEQEEIITWYLKKLNKEPRAEISDDEESQEREYFRLITNNSDFDFSYVNGKVTVTKIAYPDTESSWRQIPEGIYSAKKLSVILAVKRFQTVCLEEPGRGMHPQMIERIRDLVLRQVQDKVILITSHNPSFLSPSTLERVFLFRREQQDNFITIRPLVSKDVSEGRKNADKIGRNNEDKTGRIVTSGQSPLLFFASKVLLVEGDGDYIFANTLREVLLTTKDLIQKYIKHSKINKQQTSLAETTVVYSRAWKTEIALTAITSSKEIASMGKGGTTSLETNSYNTSTIRAVTTSEGSIAEAVATSEGFENTSNVMENDTPSTSRVSSKGLQEETTLHEIERVTPSSIIGTETHDTDTARMKTFLCSLQMIAMIGEANKFRYNDFCSRLGQHSIFLMDVDALTRNIPGQNPKSTSPEGFLRLFGILHDKDDKVKVENLCKEVKRDVSVLEKHRLFIWKGTIEAAAAALAEKHGLIQFCNENNVHLQPYIQKAVGENTEASKPCSEALVKIKTDEDVRESNNKTGNTEKGKKMKKPKTPKKLFSDKKLTNENIRNVLQKFVEVSVDDTDSEFHRLILFLVKQCEICHK